MVLLETQIFIWARDQSVECLGRPSLIRSIDSGLLTIEGAYTFRFFSTVYQYFHIYYYFK